MFKGNTAEHRLNGGPLFDIIGREFQVAERAGNEKRGTQCRKTILFAGRYKTGTHWDKANGLYLTLFSEESRFGPAGRWYHWSKEDAQPPLRAEVIVLYHVVVNLGTILER